MLWIGQVAIFPDSIHYPSELVHICENENIHCNPKWASKREIPEEGSRQHWSSRNFLLYTKEQAMHSHPMSMWQMVGLSKPCRLSLLKQGFMDEILSPARSPLNGMTAPAASSVTVFTCRRSVPLYPKEISSDMLFQISSPQD